MYLGSINTEKLKAVEEAEMHLYMIKYTLWSGDDTQQYRVHLERLKESLRPLNIMEVTHGSSN